MKTISTLVAGVAFGALVATGALASDLNGRSLKDGGRDEFAAPGVVNWSGVYIGGSVGYGNANHELSLHDYFKDYCAEKGDTSVGFDEHGNLDHNAWKTVENKKEAFEGITGDTCETLAKSDQYKRWFAAGSHVTVPGDSR